MKDCWKHSLKTYLACMNDCSDPKTNDNFFDITKDFMSYFDQFYIKTCFRQVWKIVKCKLLEVFLLVTCKSVIWPTEMSHVLLLFYLSCKLKRVGRLHDVKQLFWKPANDKNCFKLPLRYKLNQVEGHWRVNLTSYEDNHSCSLHMYFLENFACDKFAIQNIYQRNFSEAALEVIQ